MNRKIIFLDFDGVLHPTQFLGFEEINGELVLTDEDCKFCWADYLWEILNGAICDLVVHSSWRNYYSLEEIRAMLPEELANRVIAVTHGKDRYESIMEYVQRIRPDAYLILDDSADEFPDNCSELLLCDSQQGVTDPSVRIAISNFISSCNEKVGTELIPNEIPSEVQLTEIETAWARFLSAKMPSSDDLLSFAEIDLASDTDGPGIYQIWTKSGKALKVGIAANLRKRLRKHLASRDSGLKLIAGGNAYNPNDWVSKASILAKHLYFDRNLITECDLTTEKGRRRFLEDECKITYLSTRSREEARQMEDVLEKTGRFRYLGQVKVR
jgi:hypothetical protein